MSRPSFHSLYISLLRQGKVLSRHKVLCCLCPLSRNRRTLSQHGIFFLARSLSRLKSLCRDKKKNPSSRKPLSRHGKSYHDTKSSVAFIPCRDIVNSVATWNRPSQQLSLSRQRMPCRDIKSPSFASLCCDEEKSCRNTNPLSFGYPLS